MRRVSPAKRGASASLAFASCGVAATVLYAIDIAPVVAYAVVGLGSIAVLALSLRRHGAGTRRAWVLVTWSLVFFMTGTLVSPWASKINGLELIHHALALPGYLLMIAGVGVLLAARKSLERHAFIDGLIVCVAVAVASALLLAIPAAETPGRTVTVSVIAAVYPLLDAVLVLLAANLAFTTAVRQPSFVMLMGALLLLLAGDLAYAVIGVSGNLTGSPLLNVPFLLAFTMVGASALHPSVWTMDQVEPRRVQEWSWSRLTVIGAASAVPFVLTFATAGASLVERAVLSVGGGLLIALLLIRAVSAVHGYTTAQVRYAHQANHDPLTGLPNRRMLTADVQRALTTPRPAGERLWMFFLDLDGFKFVNDSFGHSTGDRLIVDVGGRLRTVVPASATVARVGGDEFVVLHPCDEREATRLAQNVMDCLQQPFRVGDAEVVIGGSMGIAGSGTGGDSPTSAESLMRDADTAMYRSKSAGRGGWTVFDTSMHETVRERIEIEAALRIAVAQDQLEVAYQPIVDLSTGHPVGAEALVRWNHPLRGPLPPALFIPIAEDTGVIAALGTWVLRRSIEQLAAWRTGGSVSGDFWMSINVSPRQLIDCGFAGLVRDALDRHGVPAARVVLEITESVMVEADTITETVLRDLRDLGVGVSVDDFGTGFSALGYLRRHPVTGVKIDRSFVAGLGSSIEDEAIVRAVVAMSTALNLSVVAEGVETEVQRDVLDGLGVTLGQGWLWGRAVAPSTFAQQWAPTVVPVTAA